MMKKIFGYLLYVLAVLPILQISISIPCQGRQGLVMIPFAILYSFAFARGGYKLIHNVFNKQFSTKKIVLCYILEILVITFVGLTICTILGVNQVFINWTVCIGLIVITRILPPSKILARLKNR